MSVQRTTFETEIRKNAIDWRKAIDNLNSLNMEEMLDTLNGVPQPKRGDVINAAEDVLTKQRNWTGSFKRIKFAMDVVINRKITWYPNDLPDGQADDARDFLTPFFRLVSSRAGRANFDWPNQAATAAILEINPASIGLDVEFAGSIFEHMGQYGFTRPVRGESLHVNGQWRRSSDSSVPVPQGTVKAAMYHTHGAGIENAGAESYSGDDIIIATARTQLSYLGTPSAESRN